MMDSDFIQDTKVVGSAALVCAIDYAQIFNQMITLAISICTFVYVAARAYQTIASLYEPTKKRRRK